MIITCENCSKKFNINPDLIPVNGRLLQCSSCDHQWFYKNQNNDDIIKQPNNTKFDKSEEIRSSKKIKEQADLDVTHEINDNNKDKHENNIKSNNKILSIIIVFIITFLAIIILIDTFKRPISSIYPNIEFILYSLYESIKDLKLFFLDLF
jgi:predicted Zn finger-like uncharacterized protein